jgi:Protein of unknown function (DUF3617)
MRMKQSGIVIALILGSTTAYAEPLDVKTGLWEITITSEMSGMLPIDMSKATPEEKARFETAMKSVQARGPRTHVHKSCMTKEKVEREPFQEKEKGSCTRTVISSTRTLWRAKRMCSDPKIVDESKIEALSRERIKGTFQVNESENKHATVIHVSIAGKWLGSDCGGIK